MDVKKFAIRRYRELKNGKEKGKPMRYTIHRARDSVFNNGGG